MNLCRCPHCRSIFQVSIPHDHPVWERLAQDEEGLAYWVCLDCRHQGKTDVEAKDVRTVGHDTSFRPSDWR
jgi:hypothetical protein